MKVHILTACSRPENLAEVGASLSYAATAHEIVWHVRFDPKQRHVGGQALKNAMLDEITDGWVVFLDDDTKMHPDLLERVMRFRDADAVVVSQRRTDGPVLSASRERLVVGQVDIGQAVIRREVIGDTRIPEDYDGDGVFLGAVLRERQKVVFLDEVLSWHNALR